MRQRVRRAVLAREPDPDANVPDTPGSASVDGCRHEMRVSLRDDLFVVANAGLN